MNKKIKYYQYKNLNKEQLLKFITDNKIKINIEKYTAKKTASGIKDDIFEALKKTNEKTIFTVQTEEGPIFIFKAKNKNQIGAYIEKNYNWPKDSIYLIEKAKIEEI